MPIYARLGSRSPRPLRIRLISFPTLCRARPSSYALCRFIQNSGDVPKYCPSRSAVSAVTFRYPASIR